MDEFPDGRPAGIRANREPGPERSVPPSVPASSPIPDPLLPEGRPMLRELVFRPAAPRSLSVAVFALSLAAGGTARPGVGDGDAPTNDPFDALRAAMIADQVDPDDADALLHGVGDAERAAKALSRFLDDRLDRERTDPVERALLQRDLWAAFDVVDGRGHRHLKSLLAAAIRRVALDAEQIARLPGPGPESPAPEGLFDPAGEWVEVADADGWSPTLAPAHARAVTDRSAFSVHLRLPGGRDAARSYLGALRAFGVALVVDGESESMRLDPGVPQLPVGAQVALVRRALLVDADCNPVVSPIVESVESRTFRKVEPFRFQGERCQDVAVAVLARRSLLAGGPSLRALEPGEISVNPFRERYHGDARRIDFLGQCMSCHAAAGIYSVNVWKRDEVGCPTDALELPRHRMPRRLVVADPDQGAWRAEAASAAKRASATFGELRTLW